MRRHILLIGLPGSGKTTIGRLVAETLQTGFVDTDNMVVRKMQMPVNRIFAEYGEPKFRELEREAMASALSGPPSVIAAGGGWVAQPGQLEAAQSNSLIVYVKTMAMTAAKRAGGEGTRPLLVGEDPVLRMRTLLQEREAFYLKADCEVKNDVKPVSAVVQEVVSLAREHANW